MPIIGIVASSITNNLVTTTPAYESLFSTRLSSTQQAITFSSIPQTFKHLQLRWAGASGDDYLYFTTNHGNGGTAGRISYYGGSFYNGMGGAQDATYGVELHFGGIGEASPGAGIIDIYDYSSTTKLKVGLSRCVRPFSADNQYTVNNLVDFTCGASATGQITSVTFQARPAYPLRVGTTVSLYGIRG